MTTLFTSESVSEGHPDKICDAISDKLTDLFIGHDSQARTAIETLATKDQIILAGETSTTAKISDSEIIDTIRQTIKDIGYTGECFNYRKIKILNLLHKQSADIALGVDKDGAGDQGIMFGYAKKEGDFDSCYMPLAIKLSHLILENLSAYRHQNPNCGILPDSKSQVTIEYEKDIPVGIKKIVLSTQHQKDLSIEDVRSIVIPIIKSSLPNNWMPSEKDILINPTGRFVIGGPEGDTGLTGRKIIVDTYGGYAPHGGGAFSGKDPTKVDRSSAYMLRYLAKNVVASGLAEQCLLQSSYAIGVAEPLSFYINTYKTSKVEEDKILRTLQEIVDLTPKGIIKHLQLQRPIYYPTSSYGHFGRTPLSQGEFSWEKLDLVKELQSCF